MSAIGRLMDMETPRTRWWLWPACQIITRHRVPTGWCWCHRFVTYRFVFEDQP